MQNLVASVFLLSCGTKKKNCGTRLIRRQGRTLGCPSQTCFFENQNSQPIPVVFRGWFEGSQKEKEGKHGGGDEELGEVEEASKVT